MRFLYLIVSRMKPWMTSALLCVVTTAFVPVALADSASPDAAKAQTRGPGNTATNGLGQRGADQRQPPSSFVNNQRQLSARDMDAKWNRYLKDPRWRALEQEARKRGYRRVKGEKRVWGYEADVVNEDGSASRLQMSVFDLQRGKDGAGLIWMQINAESKVMLVEVPEGTEVQDALEWTADNAGNVGRLGQVGEVRTRSVRMYLACMRGDERYWRTQTALHTMAFMAGAFSVGTFGCAITASSFIPFSLAVYFPCMVANVGWSVFLPLNSYCWTYW